MTRWTTGNDEDDEKYADQLEAEVTVEFVFEDGRKHGYIIDPETGDQVKVYLKEEDNEPPDDSED